MLRRKKKIGFVEFFADILMLTMSPEGGNTKTKE